MEGVLGALDSVGVSPEMAGGIAGTAAGNALGGFGGGKANPYGNPIFDQNNPDFQYVNMIVNSMNDTLRQAQTNAINQSTAYNNQAQGQIQQGLSQSNAALAQYLASGSQLAQQNAQQGVQQYQQLQKPYATAGYNALDQYEDSLGLKRPQVGTSTIQNALAQKQAADQLIQQYGGNLTTLTTKPTQPNAPTLLTMPTLQDVFKQITPQQIAAYITANSTGAAAGVGGSAAYQGIGSLATGQTGVGTYYNDIKDILSNGSITQPIQTLLANQQYGQAVQNTQTQNNQLLSQYQQQMQAYQNQVNQNAQFNSAFNNLGFNQQNMNIAMAASRGLFQ